MNYKNELVAQLIIISSVYWDDPEVAHSEADDLLLAYINEPDVEAAFNDVEKWYA